MEDGDFNPSKAASDMQLRTRKEQRFDEVEADLPDPRAANHQLPAGLGVSSILGRIVAMNPFAKSLSKGDLVWLFDNTAFEKGDAGAWHAEFVAAVFEGDARGRVADIVSGIASKVGLADDAAERRTIETRIGPFLWDIKVGRTINIEEGGSEMKLGPTRLNGSCSEIKRISGGAKGSFTEARAVVPGGVEGILQMKTFYAGAEGWGVISDIDDTIKITATGDPIGILRTTFVEDPCPIPGMPGLYAEIRASLQEDTPWFYLSASPYNLYPFLRQFRDKYYPAGTMILRDFSWKTIAGLLSALTMGTEEYKVDQMRKIASWLPKRKMIAVGDSTQSDPEAYGEIYRTFPGWIKLILIRKATDIAEIGLEEKNEPVRFERAFKGIPRTAWHVFEDPSECVPIVNNCINEA